MCWALPFHCFVSFRLTPPYLTSDGHLSVPDASDTSSLQLSNVPTSLSAPHPLPPLVRHPVSSLQKHGPPFDPQSLESSTPPLPLHPRTFAWIILSVPSSLCSNVTLSEGFSSHPARWTPAQPIKLHLTSARYCRLSPSTSLSS